MRQKSEQVTQKLNTIIQKIKDLEVTDKNIKGYKTTLKTQVKNWDTTIILSKKGEQRQIIKVIDLIDTRRKTKDNKDE